MPVRQDTARITVSVNRFARNALLAIREQATLKVPVVALYVGQIRTRSPLATLRAHHAPQTLLLVVEKWRAPVLQGTTALHPLQRVQLVQLIPASRLQAMVQ